MDKKKKILKDVEFDIPDETPVFKPTHIKQIVEVVEMDNIPETISSTAQPDTDKKLDEKSENDVSDFEEVKNEDTDDKESVQSAVMPNEQPNPEIGNEEKFNQDTQKQEDSSEIKKSVVEEIYSRSGGEDKLSEITINRSGKKTPVLWAFLVLLVAVITSVTLLSIAGKTGSGVGSGFASKPTPTIPPSPTLMPTPIPVLTREEIVIEVVNGGGVPGAGGKMKTFLTDKGYRVENVTNAEEYSYQETEILVKSNKSGAIDLLKTDLSEDYTVGTTSSALEEGSPYDARVIVGKE